MKQPSKCKVFKAIQVNTPLRASTDFLHLVVQMIGTVLEFCYVPERKISTITTLEHWDTATNTYGHELGTLRVEETEIETIDNRVPAVQNETSRI